VPRSPFAVKTSAISGDKGRRLWHDLTMSTQAQAKKSGKRPRDANRLAKLVVDLATGNAEEPPQEPAKNPHAVALGRLGGLKGGKARAAKLSAKKRKEIAKKAAAARWRRD
jgi:hypothetical protein